MSDEILWVIAGVIVRTIIPYIISYIDSKGSNPFDWRYLISIVVAAVLSYLTSLIDPSILESLAELAPLLGLGIGWFSTDLGREVQKFLGIWLPFFRVGGHVDGEIEPA